MNFIISSILLGVISSLHCIGMCGPIALAIPLKRDSKIKILSGVLQYNFGRVLMYTILGFLVGFIGLGIQLIGILQIISIISGIGILLFAWRENIASNFNLSFEIKGTLFSIPMFKKIMKSNNSFKLIFLGIINGLLPCAMIYTALINAINTGNPLLASLSMFYFGLGTVPMMLFIGFYARKISNRFQSKIKTILPILLSIVGILIILRGLNLDIPYISPKATISKDKKNIEIKECHPIDQPKNRK